jgi:ADP-glucose pyrophosphorylase
MAIPFVTIKLDKEYDLRMDFSAMIKYEQMTGRKISEAIENVSPTDAVDFMYVMLNVKDSAITKDVAMKLLDDHAESTLSIVKFVASAIGAAVLGKNSKNAPTTKNTNS